MGETKLISVVIPLYNAEKTIVKVLDSIMNQTKKELIGEIVVVNDGSKDNSENVVREYCENNKEIAIRIINKENGGVSTARNRGIKESKCEWIALEDSDDIWHAHKIEHQWHYIKKYPKIMAIGGNRDGELVKFGEKIEDGLYSMNCIQYLTKNWPHTSTLLIKKEVFDKTGLFDETMTHAEDGDLFMRIAQQVGLYYTYKSLENCGDGKASFGESGLSRDIKKMHKGVNKMYKHALELRYINKLQYSSLYLYELLKYIRRKIIVFIRKSKK